MKIIVWGINYAPETTGIGPCTTSLCRFLVERGHLVQMVTTFPYYPSWAKAPADRRRLFRTDLIDKVRVHRCWHYVPQRVTTLRRIAHEASFVMSSLFRLVTLPPADLLIVVSPPLLQGPAAWVISRLRSMPFHFHVQDLQPDAAATLGLIKNKLLLRVLLALEKFSYAKADSLSGISQGMLDLFQAKGVPARKLFFFPNPVAPPTDLPPPGRFRQRHGLAPDRFLAVYAGNFGQKQGLESVIQAMAHLAGSNIHLVLCGEGTQRARLAELSKEASNISLLPLQSAAQYAELLADADLCLIPQQPGTGQVFFPSKLLSALAHGKPVLAVADSDSELVRLLRTYRFGLEAPPAQPELLAEVLQQASQERDRLRSYGEAGLRFVQQFAPEVVLARVERHLQEMAQPATSLEETRPAASVAANTR